MKCMSKHPYRYFSSKEKLLKLWTPTFSLIENHQIINVYGVWDCIYGKWFDNCPIVIHFETGFLCIDVHCEEYFSLGWNDIDISEKPYWLCSQGGLTIKDFEWKEDLIWKNYESLSDIYNKPILSVQIIGNTREVRGIAFRIENNTLCIENNGDCIVAYLSEQALFKQ